MNVSNIDVTGARILIVDDVMASVTVLRDMLMLEGYAISVIVSPENVKEHLRRKKPDLILLDYIIPNVNGITLCKELKRDNDFMDIPIIIMTGSNDPDILAMAFQCGAADFIRKPFVFQEVLVRVKTHIRLGLAIRYMSACGILGKQLSVTNLREMTRE